MQGIVSSKDGSIGYIMQGCNKQSRRSKGCQLEIKPCWSNANKYQRRRKRRWNKTALALYKDIMELIFFFFFRLSALITFQARLKSMSSKCKNCFYEIGIFLELSYFHKPSLLQYYVNLNMLMETSVGASGTSSPKMAASLKVFL